MEAVQRRRSRLAIAVASVVLAGCSAGASSAAPPTGHRLTVVASLFPLAEVARWVGGNRVVITDLTPAGVQPRDLALSAAQVVTIHGAGVVIDVGGGFQSAVETAAAGRPSTVSLLPAIGGPDPHIWLDPVLMQQVVGMVARTFDRADPAGAATFDRGAREFDAALGAMDISYRTSLSDCARRDIMTPDEAFGRLAARYGLTVDAISSQPSAAAPDPRRLAQLADLARRKAITTVFTAPLAPSGPSQALAHQAHLKTAVLDPIDGLTQATETRHVTYLSLMADNLDRLRSALTCATSEG